ncbi:MAG: hypothetical protein V5783_03320 [Pontiella sp.]
MSARKIKCIWALGVVGIIASAFAKQGNDTVENKWIREAALSGSYTLENEFISRTISADGSLNTVKIVNKLGGKILLPTNDEEFRLRISKGTHTVGSDVTLTAKDFNVLSVRAYNHNDTDGLAVQLENVKYKLSVVVHYELAKGEFYARKFLEIASENTMTLERIDVEVLRFPDAFQPYTLKQITAQSLKKISAKSGYVPERAGNITDFKPGLGQPLYTKLSATFWGIEFPAASNYVQEDELNCGYLLGREIEPNETYVTYKAVVGVADDFDFIDDAFYDYINAIKIRPLRLQVQYNSWFDFSQNVNKENFGKSIKKVYQELVVERGAQPLNAYVIDDGWQDSFSKTSDWSDKLWKINTKRFDPDFKSTHELVKSQKGTLGLWYSPGCFFGAKKMVKKLEKQGFESLGFSMSMSGPKYMDAFEKRTLELAELGISYFKFDGVFGHLYTRAFELDGRGAPSMPQLDTAGFTNTDPRLNDSKYDELKTYYLVAGTERLIEIFTKVSKINPKVFLAITNGAYLSPWWLQHVDLVWLINAADGATGEGRSGELVYRDGVYHDIWQQENTKFPMHAIFNHEPKKVKTGESNEQFAEYLLMNLSRGTGFVEFYIKTENLAERDWDVIAEGLQWVYDAFPTFEKVKMHGGSPRKLEVYGYTAWNESRGYISFHNPSKEIREYTVVLDRKFGLGKENDRVFGISSPLPNANDFAGKTVTYGDEITITIAPGEVKILDFKIAPGND